MKTKIITAIICFITTSTTSAQSALRPGDNVNTYFQNNLNSFTVTRKIKAMNQAKDMQVVIAGHRFYKKGCPSVLSVKVGKNKAYLFGIVQGIKNKSYFLMDFDGDGKLDTKTKHLILPYWVYFPIDIPRKNNHQFIKMLDDMYASFQFDGGPMHKDSAMKKSLNNMLDALTNTNTPDRDLFFAMDFFVRYNPKFRPASLACLKTVIQETGKRYKKKHPLLYLYLVETLIKLDRKDDALQVNKHLLKLDPDCVAAKSYDYKLEKDPGKKTEKLKKIKKEHPNHWIVKTLK